jgi:hypothetical protein
MTPLLFVIRNDSVIVVSTVASSPPFNIEEAEVFPSNPARSQRNGSFLSDGQRRPRSVTGKDGSILCNERKAGEELQRLRVGGTSLPGTSTRRMKVAYLFYRQGVVAGPESPPSSID